jgi:hypothetical protein
MKMPWETAIESVTGLISEFIVDDDLRAKLNVELQKIEAGVTTQLLQTTTTPKVDAFVKILIAIKNVIIPLLRPLGAGCMTAFGMYCHYNSLPLDGATQVVMDGAFPAWGASRHVEKQKKIRKKSNNDDDWDTDD